MREKKPLDNMTNLSNGIRVYYPEGIRLSQNRKEKFVEMTDFIANNFGQPVFAIYINNDDKNPDKLWAIKIAFKRDREQMGERALPLEPT